jgi:hypothetical protein
MSVTAGNWINVLYCSTRGDTARYTCVHKWRLHLRELDCPKLQTIGLRTIRPKAMNAITRPIATQVT